MPTFGRDDDRRPGHGEADSAALDGWRVLVPRPIDRAGELSRLLRAVGAEPVSVPLIAIDAPEDPGPLDLRLIDLADGMFTWVGFTSTNAVDAVVARSAALGLSPAVPADTRIAAVGPGTASALRKSGLPVDLVPPGAGSAAAVAALWPAARDGESVLLPRSDIARSGLPDTLLAKGYRVETVTAYRTVVQQLPAGAAAEIGSGGFDAVLLTSPSCATALAGLSIAPSTVLGAIGLPTAQACAATGRAVTYVATQPTAVALVEGLRSAAAARPRLQTPPIPHPVQPESSSTET